MQSPRHDATALAAHVLGQERLELALAPSGAGRVRRASSPAWSSADGTASRCSTWSARPGFRYLTLLVEPGVFVPRPETEVVAQVAIDEAVAARPDPLVVDLCCGAGGIALVGRHRGPRRDACVAVDLSAEAVDLTRRNARRRCRRTSASSTATSPTRALLRELDGTVDVLVANPPYIPPDAEPVDPEVRDHDPDLALYGGGLDGLEVPRAVLRAAARLLRPGGLLVMEHAEVQDAAAAGGRPRDGRVRRVESRADLTGRPRMLVARRSRPAARDRLGAVNERITPASDPTTWGPAIDEAVNVLSRGRPRRPADRHRLRHRRRRVHAARRAGAAGRQGSRPADAAARC